MAAMSMAAAWVDMCRPSAISANEPNRLPPTISTSIIAEQSAITAQVFRSFRAWPSPRKMWLWAAGRSRSSGLVMSAASLEVAMDHVDQLVCGLAVERAGVRLAVDQVRADVVLDHDGQEPVDGAAARRNQVHDLCTASLAFERALDGLDLPVDSTDPVQQLALLEDRI